MSPGFSSDLVSVNDVTSGTTDSHLLEQRSGLLRNGLGDVESRVATDSCWMAPQQRLRRGNGGGGGGGKKSS